jgi:hypothetical protein
MVADALKIVIVYQAAVIRRFAFHRRHQMVERAVVTMRSVYQVAVTELEVRLVLLNANHS